MTSTPAATVRVEAFHNLDTEDDEYKPGHRVTRVFATDEPAADPTEICKEIHRLLTTGDAPRGRWPDPRAVAYRRRGNRGLGLGDLIAISGPTGTAHYALTLTYAPVRPPHRTDEPFYATIPLGHEPPEARPPHRRVRVALSTALRILAYHMVTARYRWMFDPVRSEAAAHWAETHPARPREANDRAA